MSSSAISFTNNKYIIVRNFLDKDFIRLVSAYMQNYINRGNFNPSRDGDNESKISWYADPLIETILDTCTAGVELQTGLNLIPTYSYARVYREGDELVRHVDRPACEISVTCNVYANTKQFIYMQDELNGGNEVEIFLEPGDAIIYRGCEIVHWRKKLQPGEINAQFMMHYVQKDGQYADRAYDTRPGLGYSYLSRKKMSRN